MGMKIVFKKLRGHNETVYATYDSGVITIDLSKRANPAHSYIHEKLHLKYGDNMSETQVKAETARIWKSLSIKERLKVYRELFK